MTRATTKQKLLLTFRPPEDVFAMAEKEFDLISEGEGTLAVSRLIELAIEHQPVAMLISHSQKLSRDDIAKIPATVKIVATSSVGYDNLDVPTFKARGIVNTNTPDVLTDATADMAMLLLLGVCRRLPEHVALIKDGWGRSLAQGELLGTDLNGKTVGIFGMGRIGQAFARRAQAFGLTVIYSNRRRLSVDQEHGAEFVPTLHEMLPRCEILSLHAPGTKETEKIIGTREFQLLPEGAVLVNVARGTLIDEDALFDALDSGHLRAAGLDVCWNEPHPDARFKKYSNVLLTPHVASATRETRNAMGFRALENIRLVLAGKPARDSLS